MIANDCRRLRESPGLGRLPSATGCGRLAADLHGAPATSADCGPRPFQVFGTRSARARDGLRLLMRTPRVSVTMLSPDDWAFLLAHCDRRAVEAIEAFRFVHAKLPEECA